MNILHLVGGLGTSSGTTQIIWNLCKVAADEGHRPSILYLTGRGIDTWELADSRISTYSCPISTSRSWGFSPAFHQTLKRLVNTTDVIHIHSNWLYINLAASGVSLKYGIPLVVSPQGALDPWCLRHHRLRKQLYWLLLEKRIMCNAAAIHVVSEFERNSVQSLNVRTPCHVIPNGATIPKSVTHRDEACRQLGIPDKAFVILYLARINPKKGLDLLLKSLSFMPDKINFHLLVAGSDGGSGYQGEMERLARSISSKDKITWLGEVSGVRKSMAFACANTYVLPSRAEGIPISLLEAMAHGIPVLYSEACHVPEVADSGAGLSIALNTESIGQKILQLLYDPTLRQEMGRRAKALVESRFNWSSIGRSMLELYAKVQ
jgi:glycosyltransferase involved in cell wall biosynthesis